MELKAVCDWPAMCFSRELIQAYPDAKVILTTRDVDVWHRSVMRTVYWRAKDPWLRLASYVDWGASLYHPMLTKLFETFFEDDFPNQGKRLFLEHYMEVENMVPRENLLEFDVTQGWEPLCEFLKVPKPQAEPFPYSNDAASFVKRCQSRNRKQIFNGLFRYLVVAFTMKLLYRIVM